MNLNGLSIAVHLANAKWWQDIDTGAPIKRNKGELIALIHSEISEGYDGEKAGLMDDKLPHRLMGEVELIDATIRILDYAAGFSHNIFAAGQRFNLNEFATLNEFADFASHQCVGVVTHHASIHSQISKILEFERKGRPSEQVAEALFVCLIEIFDYAAMNAYDMQGAFDEKMAYNAKREDHKHEARRIAGGKQF